MVLRLETWLGMERLEAERFGVGYKPGLGMGMRLGLQRRPGPQMGYSRAWRWGQGWFWAGHGCGLGLRLETGLRFIWQWGRGWEVFGSGVEDGMWLVGHGLGLGLKWEVTSEVGGGMGWGYRGQFQGCRPLTEPPFPLAGSSRADPCVSCSRRQRRREARGPR